MVKDEGFGVFFPPLCWLLLLGVTWAGNICFFPIKEQRLAGFSQTWHSVVIYWDLRREKKKKKLEPNYRADAEGDIYSPKPHRSFIKISVLISKHLFCVWFYTDLDWLQFPSFRRSSSRALAGTGRSRAGPSCPKPPLDLGFHWIQAFLGIKLFLLTPV